MINIHEQNPSTYFCVLTIRKHLLIERFERSGGGQEPSRGHKFSILENFVFHRDFTFQTLASFQSDLVGVAFVGARPLHLACARPRCRLKAPLGLSLLRCASQTRSMRFERSGRGQEPSSGHKFSILENFLSIRDFTSQTPASFPSDLVGACLPQTLLIIRALRHEWNGVSCLHNFTEELSNRQEVQ